MGDLLSPASINDKGGMFYKIVLYSITSTWIEEAMYDQN